MKNLKEQKPNVENVQAVDVELNEEQLDVVSGGVWGDCTGGGLPIFPIKPIKPVSLPGIVPLPTSDVNG
jgi:hypothetical protein